MTAIVNAICHHLFIKPVLGCYIKKNAQAAYNLLKGENNNPELCAIPELTAQTSAVSVFDQVPPATMAKAQKDSVLGLVVPFVRKGVKPKVTVIAKIQSKQQGNIWEFQVNFEAGCATSYLHL